MISDKSWNYLPTCRERTTLDKYEFSHETDKMLQKPQRYYDALETKIKNHCILLFMINEYVLMYLIKIFCIGDTLESIFRRCIMRIIASCQLHLANSVIKFMMDHVLPLLRAVI